MTETINRIEEALENNWAVEAEDIRALVNHAQAQDKIIDMFIKQIQKLEKESPNDYTKT